MEKIGHTDYKIVEDVVDRPPSSFSATICDLVFIIYAIFVHVIDTGLDINLAYTYYVHEEYIYFILTLIFMIVPSLIVTVISSCMYAQDKYIVCQKSECSALSYVLFLIFQQAALLRYKDSMKYALLSRQAQRDGNHEKQVKYYKKMLEEDCDIALLRVFKCYLESAPQQILQITILLTDYHQGTTLYVVQQSLSIVSSFIAMSMCIVSYNRAIRFQQDDKNNITWLGSFVQGLWHLCVAISRIISFSILASVEPVWTLIGCSLHSSLMTIWLVYMGRTMFCSSYCTHLLFSTSLGLVYTFNYLNVHEGTTRYNYLYYYSVCLVENVACVVTWALLTHRILKSSWYFYPAVVLPVLSFLLGMVCLVAYYKYFHPRHSLPTTDVHKQQADSLDNADKTRFFAKFMSVDLRIHRRRISHTLDKRDKINNSLCDM